jgi:hypothetical protein
VEPAQEGEARPLLLSHNPEFAPDWQPLGPMPVPIQGEGPCIYELRPRTVTLDLRRHLVARGRVNSVEGTSTCAGGWVRVDRRTRRGWQAVGNMTLTDNEGRFRAELPDRTGRYRATVTADAQCDVARSVVRVHRH